MHFGSAIACDDRDAVRDESSTPVAFFAPLARGIAADSGASARIAASVEGGAPATSGRDCVSSWRR